MYTEVLLENDYGALFALGVDIRLLRLGPKGMDEDGDNDQSYSDRRDRRLCCSRLHRGLKRGTQPAFRD